MKSRLYQYKSVRIASQREAHKKAMSADIAVSIRVVNTIFHNTIKFNKQLL